MLFFWSHEPQLVHPRSRKKVQVLHFPESRNSSLSNFFPFGAIFFLLQVQENVQLIAEGFIWQLILNPYQIILTSSSFGYQCQFTVFLIQTEVFLTLHVTSVFSLDILVMMLGESWSYLNHLFQHAVALFRFSIQVLANFMGQSLYDCLVSSPCSAILFFICLVLQGLLLSPTGAICRDGRNFHEPPAVTEQLLEGRGQSHCVCVSLCHCVEGRKWQDFAAAAAVSKLVCLLVPQLLSQVWDGPLGLCCLSCLQIDPPTGSGL